MVPVYDLSGDWRFVTEEVLFDFDCVQHVIGRQLHDQVLAHFQRRRQPVQTFAFLLHELAEKLLTCRREVVALLLRDVQRLVHVQKLLKVFRRILQAVLQGEGG